MAHPSEVLDFVGDSIFQHRILGWGPDTKASDSMALTYFILLSVCMLVKHKVALGFNDY